MLGIGGKPPNAMRLAFVALLLVWIWITLLCGDHTMGGFVHLFLVLAIASGLASVARKPRVLGAATGLLENVFSKGKK